MTSLEQLKKKLLFSPGWRVPRIPAPSWPQSAAWLPSWWRRWMRRGRLIVSPSWGSFKSVIVFFKAFKWLIKPLSHLLPWRDRFVPTSSDRCVFLLQYFACLLHYFKVTALIQWPLNTFCIQRQFHDIAFRLLSCRRNGLPMRFHRIEWSAPQSTQYLTKTCGVCHLCVICPECVRNLHFCACGPSSALHVPCSTCTAASVFHVWHHGLDSVW